MLHMLVAVPAEARVEIAAEQQRFTREHRTLGGDARTIDRIVHGAGAGDEVFPQPWTGDVGMSPTDRRMHPLDLPVVAGGIGIVLQQQDNVAAHQRRQQEQGAVLVPRNAHVASGHGQHLALAQHVERAVGGAVVGHRDDGPWMAGVLLHAVERLAQDRPAVIGDDADAEQQRRGDMRRGGGGRRRGGGGRRRGGSGRRRGGSGQRRTRLRCQ